ncbi:anti-anti-sigma factor [Sinobacterium caligoides]|uniref:Anti-anti-sigma factor n=1 Tax=Sinobacterium caligoides TaxID=933926 RepID=A0A3N2DY78_9GAMM|nr:STAS domain-containing protein [Sinobacterium caligoides]ROS04810.1 anti-anti-sigma factor [Sinobacterium caligoides]
MQTGKIWVAKHDGAYMIKFVGDVRMTWCTSFDKYLQLIFLDESFKSILIDVSEAEGIDSTTLGLLAKLAIQAQRHYQHTPVIYSPEPSITRLLESMGFADVFSMTGTLEGAWDDVVSLSDGDCSEEEVRDKVIEAHKVLMTMNEGNRLKFEELVSTLEASIDS